MHKERLWFGTALVVAPLLIFLLTIAPRSEANRNGPVEGHVSIQGRPMDGGFILFIPDDLKLNAAVGWVDEKGYYAVSPNWHRKGARDETRFRICLIPKPRHRSGGGLSAPNRGDHHGATEQADDGDPKVIEKVAGGIPRRLSDPRTSPLEVRLDSRPAKVDIAL